VAVRVLGIGYGAACKAVGAANLRSTLIGIPVTGLLMAAVLVWALIAVRPELDTTLGGFAATTLVLTGYTDEWMIPAAAILYSVPFFFMSVYVERRYMEKCVTEDARLALIAGRAGESIVLRPHRGWPGRDDGSGAAQVECLPSLGTPISEADLP